MTKPAHTLASQFFYDPSQNDENSARALSRTINFADGNPVVIQAPLIDLGLFTCQTLYVDNADNTNVVTITFRGIPYRLKIKASTQGFYPVLTSADMLDVLIQSASSTGTTTVIFINAALVGEMTNWSTV